MEKMNSWTHMLFSLKEAQSSKLRFVFYFPYISLLNIREHNMSHVFHAENPEESSPV